MIKRLISKIEIHAEGFRLHYKVGRDTIEGELASAGSPAFYGRKKSGLNISGSNSLLTSRSVAGSRTLTNGDPGGLLTNSTT